MITKARSKRRKRIRARVIGTSERPRVSVYRSNNFIYVQLIDDSQAKTLASANEHELKKVKATKTERAQLLGESLAQKALKQEIKQVVFDRGGYKYHGRVKAVAEGLRAKGINV